MLGESVDGLMHVLWLGSSLDIHRYFVLAENHGSRHLLPDLLPSSLSHNVGSDAPERTLKSSTLDSEARVEDASRLIGFGQFYEWLPMRLLLRTYILLRALATVMRACNEPGARYGWSCAN